MSLINHILFRNYFSFNNNTFAQTGGTIPSVIYQAVPVSGHYVCELSELEIQDQKTFAKKN
jgi:hypothetical protein